MRRYAAFTLIELMTTISIISILMAIAFFALTSMRQTAADTETLSVIRGVEIDMADYKYKNNGRFPAAAVAASPEYAQKLSSNPAWQYIASTDRRSYCIAAVGIVNKPEKQPSLNVQCPRTWVSCHGGEESKTLFTCASTVNLGGNGGSVIGDTIKNTTQPQTQSESGGSPTQAQQRSQTTDAITSGQPIWSQPAQEVVAQDSGSGTTTVPLPTCSLSAVWGDGGFNTGWLTWTSANAKSAYIDNGIGAVPLSAQNFSVTCWESDFGRAQTIALSWTLTVTNDNGAKKCSVTPPLGYGRCKYAGGM